VPRERCLQEGTEAVAGVQAEGNCIERGWRICRIEAGWIDIVAVAVVVRIVGIAAAAAVVVAYRSVEEPSVVAVAVVAFVAEAYRSAAGPSVSARMGSVWRFVGSSECFAVTCSIVAGSSALVAVVAELALAEVH